MPIVRIVEYYKEPKTKQRNKHAVQVAASDRNHCAPRMMQHIRNHTR